MPVFPVADDSGVIFQKGILSDAAWLWEEIKIIFKLYHERNIGSEAAEGGNEWQKRCQSRCFCLCPRVSSNLPHTPRWLEQNLSELNSTGQTDSLCRSCSLCLAFLGFCYLALTLLNGYKKFISAYLHGTSGRTQTKTIVPTFHPRHSFNLIGFELQLK